MKTFDELSKLLANEVQQLADQNDDFNTGVDIFVRAANHALQHYLKAETHLIDARLIENALLDARFKVI